MPLWATGLVPKVFWRPAAKVTGSLSWTAVLARVVVIQARLPHRELTVFTISHAAVDVVTL